jgi:tRNA uridine 5-carboxymethylaminomethyl modification enzyme
MTFRKEENLLFPQDLDFWSIDFLSNEEKQKLTKFKPQTLGQANRIDGITASSLVLLHSICKKNKRHNPPDGALEI